MSAQWSLQPATPAVRDMVVTPDGLVSGLAEPNRFFVFNPDTGAFVRDEVWDGYGAVSGWQAPRCMAFGSDGNIYALFREAILRIDPVTFIREEIVRPGIPITSGIAIVADRLYFGSGPRLFSCRVPSGRK